MYAMCCEQISNGYGAPTVDSRLTACVSVVPPDYGVQGGCEVQERTGVGVLAVQVSEGCVTHLFNTLMWVHIDVDGIFDVGHNQPLRALHDDRYSQAPFLK